MLLKVPSGLKNCSIVTREVYDSSLPIQRVIETTALLSAERTYFLPEFVMARIGIYFLLPMGALLRSR